MLSGQNYKNLGGSRLLGALLVAMPLLPAHAQTPPAPSGGPTLRQLEQPERPPLPGYQPPAETPVLPVLPYGLTATFAAAYPGSPTLRVETYAALLREQPTAGLRTEFKDYGDERKALEAAGLTA